MGRTGGETQQLQELHVARGSAATVVATPAGAATAGGASAVADGPCPTSASRSNSKSSHSSSSDGGVTSTEVVPVPDKERASLSSRVQRLSKSPHRSQRNQAKTAPQTAPQPAPPSPVNSDAAVAASSSGRSVGAAAPSLSCGGSLVGAAASTGKWTDRTWIRRRSQVWEAPSRGMAHKTAVAVKKARGTLAAVGSSVQRRAGGRGWPSRTRTSRRPQAQHPHVVLPPPPRSANHPSLPLLFA